MSFSRVFVSASLFVLIIAIFPSVSFSQSLSECECEIGKSNLSSLTSKKYNISRQDLIRNPRLIAPFIRFLYLNSFTQIDCTRHETGIAEQLLNKSSSQTRYNQCVRTAEQTHGSRFQSNDQWKLDKMITSELYQYQIKLVTYDTAITNTDDYKINQSRNSLLSLNAPSLKPPGMIGFLHDILTADKYLRDNYRSPKQLNIIDYNTRQSIMRLAPWSIQNWPHGLLASEATINELSFAYERPLNLPAAITVIQGNPHIPNFCPPQSNWNSDILHHPEHEFLDYTTTDLALKYLDHLAFSKDRSLLNASKNYQMCQNKCSTPYQIHDYNSCMDTCNLENKDFEDYLVKEQVWTDRCDLQNAAYNADCVRRKENALRDQIEQCKIQHIFNPRLPDQLDWSLFDSASDCNALSAQLRVECKYQLSSMHIANGSRLLASLTKIEQCTERYCGSYNTQATAAAIQEERVKNQLAYDKRMEEALQQSTDIRNNDTLVTINKSRIELQDVYIISKPTRLNDSKERPSVAHRLGGAGDVVVTRVDDIAMTAANYEYVRNIFLKNLPKGSKNQVVSEITISEIEGDLQDERAYLNAVMPTTSYANSIQRFMQTNYREDMKFLDDLHFNQKSIRQHVFSRGSKPNETQWTSVSPDKRNSHFHIGEPSKSVIRRLTKELVNKIMAN